MEVEGDEFERFMNRIKKPKATDGGVNKVQASTK
jgi:hypothetical protein